MPQLRSTLLSALLPLLVSRALDLTEDNFNRHVYERKGGGHSFVKFYAPWCQHCKKLAPTWKAVEKMYPKSVGLLVGSVDCSDGPKGRNPLCDKHKAMSLPTLLYFHSDKKKGMFYDGNRTEEDLLAFAAELNSTCSLTEQGECTDEQKAWMVEYDALDEAKLKEKASELSSEAEMARMKMMMVQMQMQQTYQDKKLTKEAKDKAMKDFETQASDANKEIETAWAKSPSLRAMQLVLRGKKAARAGSKKRKGGSGGMGLDMDDFDPDDFDPDMMAGMADPRRGGRSVPPPPPKPKPKPKPKKPKSCQDKGPWPCDEEGCPKSKSVGCKELEGDCKLKFADVFSSPPEGLADKRVWTQCKRTCDRCAAKDEL